MATQLSKLLTNALVVSVNEGPNGLELILANGTSVRIKAMPNPLRVVAMVTPLAETKTIEMCET